MWNEIQARKLPRYLHRKQLKLIESESALRSDHLLLWSIEEKSDQIENCENLFPPTAKLERNTLIIIIIKSQLKLSKVVSFISSILSICFVYKRKLQSGPNHNNCDWIWNEIEFLKFDLIQFHISSRRVGIGVAILVTCGQYPILDLDPLPLSSDNQQTISGDIRWRKVEEIWPMWLISNIKPAISTIPNIRPRHMISSTTSQHTISADTK